MEAKIPSRPTIFLVPMPIGTEWEDLSGAARQVLKTCPNLFIEPEPQTVERMRSEGLIPADREVAWMDGGELPAVEACIQRGASLALVAATGIPGFVDPGWLVMDHWIEHWSESVDVVPVGMSSALDAALAMAGLDIRSFRFGGHYPENFAPIERPGRDPQVYYVRGPALGAFVRECRGWGPDFRRALLCANLRKRGMQRQWVIRPTGPLPADLHEDADADVVAVIEGFAGPDRLYVPSKGGFVHRLRVLYTRLRGFGREP